MAAARAEALLRSVSAPTAGLTAVASAAAFLVCRMVCRRIRGAGLPDRVESCPGGLAAALERHLRTALRAVGNDASRVVLALDLDETSFTPVQGDLGTSEWYVRTVRHWSQAARSTIVLSSDVMRQVIDKVRTVDGQAVLGFAHEGAITPGVVSGMILESVDGVAVSNRASVRAAAGRDACTCVLVLTEACVRHAVLAAVDAFYHHIPVRPSDPTLPALLRAWRQRGAMVIGITSRRPQLASATWDQMRGGADAAAREDETTCPLAFAPTESPLRVQEVERKLLARWDPPSGWEGLDCQNGVWFTSNTEKGDFLSVMLPEGIGLVFADDSRRHTDSVAECMRERTEYCASIHYTEQADRTAAQYDQAAADEDLAAVLTKLYERQDGHLMSLVRAKDPWLRMFAQEQVRNGCRHLAELAAALTLPPAGSNRASLRSVSPQTKK
eukprot:TRINITY_DN21872_c0_g1_i1.p1 TRINITY_DN21872_c0_g1~~TRINITY_DN21872_c0_g1_i1.p1  ORF type:complete len:464 (+),score=143.55 TRINITY_DN21872_c0_g1_i1:68-1393(+)